MYEWFPFFIIGFLGFFIAILLYCYHRPNSSSDRADRIKIKSASDQDEQQNSGTYEDKSIYIGNYHSPFRLKFLSDHHIAMVVNCAEECKDPWDDPLFVENALYQRYQSITYLRLNLRDDHQQDLHAHLPSTLQKIRETIERGENVLIHCAAGISRSVAIVCAYLICMEQKSPQEALSLIKRARPHANPNSHFWNQLQHLYKHKCEK